MKVWGLVWIEDKIREKACEKVKPIVQSALVKMVVTVEKKAFNKAYNTVFQLGLNALFGVSLGGLVAISGRLGCPISKAQIVATGVLGYTGVVVYKHCNKVAKQKNRDAKREKLLSIINKGDYLSKINLALVNLLLDKDVTSKCLFLEAEEKILDLILNTTVDQVLKFRGQ